ncbi:plasmid partitioning protein RepB [Rhizobium sp. KVB221]|uniref:Plasmid partitioning protein RepB n=1 Tax=Rhizobium setariae TaxID=2801340 RepID=A0A937CN49_9HYPH|nr:plasmid partitioning protein RepB [Rhizobium setariae]MBL0373401.1 plasmid partitioning protein RepB [Rhizobium setariae]
MARKDVFLNITSGDSARPERKATPGYASRGASRSMISSLGELAEKAAKAEQILQGEAIVELDPKEIDASFVSDRLDDDELAFNELVEAIRERGQDTPILVRPHPTDEGRYQIVFGHRRVRAARILGRPVRAVVKAIADVDHVIAQGQENSARENLSFIERAMFAQQLLELGYERRTIELALSIDPPMLTRMLSVAGRIPTEISTAIGAAKGVGRDRWLELVQLLEQPGNMVLMRTLVSNGGFAQASSDQRFEQVFTELKKARKPAKRTAVATAWQPNDGALTAEFKNTGKSFSLSLKAKNAGKFGKFLTENLDRLYEEFQTRERVQGD